MAASSTIVQSIEAEIELFVKVDAILLLHDGVVVCLDLGVGSKPNSNKKYNLLYFIKLFPYSVMDTRTVRVYLRSGVHWSGKSQQTYYKISVLSY